MSLEALDTVLTSGSDDVRGLCDWLQPCIEIVRSRVQIVCSSTPYQGSLDDVPTSKYSALFDWHDCFDGLRISFLGQLCGRNWENVDALLSSDIDDVRYALDGHVLAHAETAINVAAK